MRYILVKTLTDNAQFYKNHGYDQKLDKDQTEIYDQLNNGKIKIVEDLHSNILWFVRLKNCEFTQINQKDWEGTL